MQWINRKYIIFKNKMSEKMCKLTFRVLIRTSFVAWRFYINRFSAQSSLIIFAQIYSSKYKNTYFHLAK